MTTSFWAKKDTIRNLDVHTDVVIIGAGYVGLSTAYWLTELKSDLKITVLDRGLVGSGASGRNAGFLTKGSAFFYHHLMQKFDKNKAHEIFSFAQRSIELASHHLLDSFPELNFEKTTSLTLIKNKKILNDLKKNKDQLANFDFRWVASQELSPLLSKKFLGGFESSNEFKINPIQLLNLLQKELERRNVRVVEGTTAYQVEEDIVSTDTHNIKAEHIILALNGYSGQFLNQLKNFIKPYRAQMLAIKVKDSIESPSLYYDPEDRVYWRKLGDNSFLIGGKRLLDEVNEQTDFDHLNAKIQLALETYVKDVLKLDFSILHRWSGIMGFTQTELPIVTQLKTNPKVHIIGGFSGHGMGLGFHAGKDLAEVMLNQKPKSFFNDFHSFDSI